MIIVSFIVVRIGAIALQLTGLEWSLAKFQSLSCFTGTGFTTKEAELITGNSQRRRIASVLMVLGNVGLVTLVATFANTLRPALYLPQITIPFVDLVIPSFLVKWFNLMVIIVFMFIVYRVFTRTNILPNITEFLRRRLVNKDIIKPVSFEELLVATGGYGVSNIEINEKCGFNDKSIHESKLGEKDITVLAIERDGEVMPNPRGNAMMLQGDKLICFGKLDKMRSELCPGT